MANMRGLKKRLRSLGLDVGVMHSHGAQYYSIEGTDRLGDPICLYPSSKKTLFKKKASLLLEERLSKRYRTTASIIAAVTVDGSDDAGYTVCVPSSWELVSHEETPAVDYHGRYTEADRCTVASTSGHHFVVIYQHLVNGAGGWPVVAVKNSEEEAIASSDWWLGK